MTCEVKSKDCLTGSKSAQQNGEQASDLVAWSAACFGVSMDMALTRSQIDHPRLPLPIDVTKYVDVIYASVLACAPQRSVSKFTVWHREGSINYDYALRSRALQCYPTVLNH